MKEVAPFNIDFTIVEPGPAKTSFGGGLISPLPMSKYEKTPSGEMRRRVVSGKFAVLGNPVKMVRAMIDSVNCSPAPP